MYDLIPLYILTTITCLLLFCSVQAKSILPPITPEIDFIEDSLLKQQLSTTTDPKSYVEAVSKDSGVDISVTLYVLEHESRYCQDKLGDMDIFREGKPVRARGCWQITQFFHPEISDECAFDLVCSTTWAIPRLKDKKTCIHEWSTCRDYYKSIPVLADKNGLDR